ncbi:VOC family protein [Curtobacterium sp. 9128]|uniref:VOC family protein n=1 Tax=Curtobacterium sp. 9128 TaxID=1793722 RepID=UPI0011A8CD01|nr:VOC family protein [Curtobacterium sp. 9128]
MASRLNPYLGFRDTAREALEFYHAVFGGDLRLGTFGEMHGSEDPADADRIMHGQLETPSGYMIMASDTPNAMPYRPGTAISLSLSGDDAEDLRRFFAGLAEGGTVVEPLTKAPWGDEFGMLTDRFGVSWLVDISGN